VVLTLRTAREIGEMRKAGLLVWEAHRLLAARVQPGVTTAELNAVVDEFFARQGARPLFKSYPNPDGDGPPFPAATCISVNEQVVHGIPGPRRLKEGDIVSIDTGCKVNGWCGDAAATYPVGKVLPEVQRLLDVTKGVLQLAIDTMAKCRWWRDVAAEMEAYVKRARFSSVLKYVGHGVGRDMHEDPQVPNFVDRKMRRTGGFELSPGLVIAIEPMVNLGTCRVKRLKDTWTVVTADGKPSAHFEHTVAMTAAGPVVLTAGPNGETW
jgi:methionyl aminopeptidase